MTNRRFKPAAGSACGAVIGLVLSAAMLASCAPPATAPSGPVEALKLDGPGGAKSLTLAAVKAMPATEGWAGTKSRSGRTNGPDRYKGVSIVALADLVGGLAAGGSVVLTAKDGYVTALTYQQITRGDLTTYDPNSGDKTKVKGPLTVMLAYEKAGKPLDEAAEGPLKLVVVSQGKSQVVESHWAIRQVTQVTVRKARD